MSERVVLAALLAALLAGPAAGQSSEWYTGVDKGMDFAATSVATRGGYRGGQDGIMVACPGPRPIAMYRVTGRHADEAGLEHGIDDVRLDWRFDGARIYRFTGMRTVVGGLIEIHFNAAGHDVLVAELRRADYVEIRTPNVPWERWWSLVGSAAAIESLWCTGGGE